MCTVRFLNEYGKVVDKTFSSEYMARKFVNKAKHSKKIKLLSYPTFS